MKKTFILLLILVLCVGCTRIDNIENRELIIDAVLKSKDRPTNTTSLGYKYYLPIGVLKVSDIDYNQKFKIDDDYIYMYSDIVSYYYNNKEINNNGKTGYIKINNEEEGKYFIKIVYNYAKIESCVQESEINKILINGMIILDSIDYNDTLIKYLIDEEYSISVEKQYKIDKPKYAESKFSEYLSESVHEEESVPELPEY